MKISGNTLRIGFAAAVIVGTIGWLAYSGAKDNQQYLVHISELFGMGDKAFTRQLRVDGFVQPGSIEHDGPHVTFVMNEFESHSPKAATGRVLKVIYKGSEPPPDTFKDDAQAVAAGSFGRDGVFHANQLQAKCASKYAPAQPGTPAAAPAANPRAAAVTPAVQPASSRAATVPAAN
jgi:cytochrome c-type biogenesis protein CcmE